MIAMSDDFKNSISSIDREIKGYVEITYTDSTAKANANVTNCPQILQIGNSYLDDDAIVDDDRKGENYASLEEDYFQLDGTFVLPNNVADKNPGIGYVSNLTFEDDTEMSYTPFQISTSFEEDATVNGLTMYFQNNNPLELEIQITSGTDVETFTKEDCTISSNGMVQLTFSDRQISFLRIYVNDVLYPNRRLRLQEVDFGLSAVYENEELVSFTTTEQCNRFCDEMPANECDVVIGDYENNFDPINPKGITKYLNSGVEIKPYVGIVTDENGIQYCSMGIFYLTSWSKDSGNVTLNSEDIFSKLNSDDYSIKKYDTSRFNKLLYSSYLQEKSSQWGINIENLVTDNNDYIIRTDSTGATIGIPMNFIGTDSKINNLQKYCTTFGNVITGNRNGSLRYISSLKHNIFDIKVNKDVLKDYENIESKAGYKTISVVESQYAGTNNAGDSAEFATLFTKTIECNGITEFKFTFDKVEWISPLSYTYSGSGTPTLLSCNIDVNTTMQFAKQIYMKFNYVGSITITATGPKDIFALNSYENSKTFNEDGEEVKIDNDFLSYLTIFANTVDEQSNAIIDYRNQNQTKLTTSFEFNGNPMIEVGDVIQVENKYPDENGNSKYDDVWVTKIESEFNGSFSQSIEGDIIE